MLEKKDIPDKPPTPATMIEPEHCPRCSPDTYNKDMGVNRRYKILCRKCGGVWDWKHLTGYVFIEDKPGKAVPNEQYAKTFGYAYPRPNNRLDLMSPGERAINKAIIEVEKIGAHEQLTQIVIFLGNVQQMLYNYYMDFHKENKNKKMPDPILQGLSFQTSPPEWIDCGQWAFDQLEESKRRIIYPDLINCLAYALRFWEKEPYMKLYYCCGHVINSHVPIISDGSPKWLPAEEYGYNYFDGAFGDLLDEYEMNLLKKYFNV